MDDRAYLDALQDAHRRREQLRSDLDALQKKLADLDIFIAATERILRERGREVDGAPSAPNQESLEAAPQRGISGRRRNPEPPAKLAELARLEILAHGRPMTRGELVHALEGRGVEMVARDKAKNLGTILWRFRNQFDNIPGQGYWPKDHPLPGKFV